MPDVSRPSLWGRFQSLLPFSPKKLALAPIHVARRDTIGETTQKIVNRIPVPTPPAEVLVCKTALFQLSEAVCSARDTQQKIMSFFRAKLQAAGRSFNSSASPASKLMESMMLNLNQMLRENAVCPGLGRSKEARPQECAVLLSAQVLAGNIRNQAIMLQRQVKNFQATVMSIAHYQSNELIQRTVEKFLFLVRQLPNTSPLAPEAKRKLEEWGQLGKDLKQWEDESKAIELSARQVVQNINAQLHSLGLLGNVNMVPNLAALFPSFFDLSLHRPEEAIGTVEGLQAASGSADRSARIYEERPDEHMPQGKASDELLRNKMASEMAKRIVFAIIKNLLVQTPEQDVEAHVYQIVAAIERIEALQMKLLKMLIAQPTQTNEVRAITAELIETIKQMKAKKLHFLGKFDFTHDIPFELHETKGAMVAQALIEALLRNSYQKNQTLRAQKDVSQEVLSFLEEVGEKMEQPLGFFQHLYLSQEKSVPSVSADSPAGEDIRQQIHTLACGLATSEKAEHLREDLQIMSEKLKFIIWKIDLPKPASFDAQTLALSTNLKNLESQISKAENEKKEIERIRLEMYGPS